MPLLMLVKYWWVAVIAVLLIAVGISHAAYKHEKVRAVIAETSLQSAMVANQTCSSSVDTLQGKIKEYADLGRQQQVLLDNGAKKAVEAEAALRAIQLKLRAAAVPQDCEEAGDWAIAQLSLRQ